MPNEEFKRRLALLLRVFGDSPASLAEYLCAHGAFDRGFEDLVLAAEALDGHSAPEPPKHITDLDQLFEYQDGLLRPAKSAPRTEASMADSYLERLRAALEEEDYEAAASLRDMLAFIGASVPDGFL